MRTILAAAALVLLAIQGVAAFDPSSYFATLSHRSTWADAEKYCSSKKLALCSEEQVCPSGKVVGGTARARGLHWAPIGGSGMNEWVGVGSDNLCQRQSHPVWNDQRKPFKGFVACCAHTGIVPAVLSKWEGFVVKGSSKAIYIIENGFRRRIPDPATFEALGFLWSRVKTIPNPELEAIPLGEALTHLAGGKNSQVYVHPVLKYTHEAGHPWDQYEGYLIKGKGPQIYMMELFEKRVIPDPTTFEAMGFEWGLVKVLPDDLIAQIPTSNPFRKVEGARNSAPYSHPIFNYVHFGRKPGPKLISTTAFTRSLVRRLLEREPTEAELTQIDTAVRKQVPTARIIQRIVTSPEFLSKFHYGPVVDALFNQIFERKADAASRQVAVQLLANAGPTASIRNFAATSLLHSPEYAQRFLAGKGEGAIRNGVAFLFRHILDRKPDSKEWLALQKIAIKQGWAVVIQSLVDSAEYRAKTQEYGLPGKQHDHVYDSIIKRLYRKLLNREADDAGVNGWKQVLNKLGFTAVVDGFLNSREYEELNGAKAFYDEVDQPIEPAL